MKLYNERMLKTVTVGVLYLEGKYFVDDANQTIGKADVGENMVEIFANRRSVTSRVTDEGDLMKQRVVTYFKLRYGLEVKLHWSRRAGCSMCPCSPGYKIHARADNFTYVGRRKDRDNYQFSIWATNEGGLDIRDPKYEDGIKRIVKDLEPQEPQKSQAEIDEYFGNV